MRDDAVHFENLLIRVSLGDVKLPHHSCPVALTAAATEVRRIREAGSESRKKRVIFSNATDKSKILF